MKFLIIRLSSIGDIVLTSPVVRCLKQQVLTAEIHYVTKYSFRYVVESNPHIHKCHFVHDDLQEVIPDLIQEDFDYVIDLHHNLRSATIKRALKKKSYAFNKLNIEKYFYTAFKWNRMPPGHIVDRYLKTVEAFGVRNDGAGLDYFIPAADRVKENDIPASHLAGYIGLVIGAARNTKKYPLHKLEKFCETIDHPVIVMGGKEDAAAGERLAAIDPFKIYNACGKFRLNESADLVRRAKLVVTNDTGLMHIAAAFKKPIISLWGNTVPEFGMFPYYGNQHTMLFDVLEVRSLWCRPCSKIGYKKCPLGHFKCMEKISDEALVAQVAARLRP